MGLFSESVDVVCTPSGQPLTLDWAGRHYTVREEPVRWYERRQWWAEESRAPLGSGPGLVDHEIWRIQVSACAGVRPSAQGPSGQGPSEQGPSASPSPEDTLTLDLSRDLGSGRWRVLRIHDALRPQRTA
jgi:hypothetical protein